MLGRCFYIPKEHLCLVLPPLLHYIVHTLWALLYDKQLTVCYNSDSIMKKDHAFRLAELQKKSNTLGGLIFPPVVCQGLTQPSVNEEFLRITHDTFPGTLSISRKSTSFWMLSVPKESLS